MPKNEITTQTGLAVFSNDDFGSIRVVEKDGEPWLVAMDVCEILGLENVAEALSGLDTDEKSSLAYLSNSEVSNDSRNLRSSTRIISESGFYALVFRSRKPNARAFSKWVNFVN